MPPAPSRFDGWRSVAQPVDMHASRQDNVNRRMGAPDQIEPPSPRQRFAYWGPHAELTLSEDLPAVILEYATEPPHGDPLYELTIGGITVGGWKRPLLFFGRDMHLSQCSRFLAIARDLFMSSI